MFYHFIFLSSLTTNPFNEINRYIYIKKQPSHNSWAVLYQRRQCLFAYFKASFKAFPALNAGYLLASISIVSPVCKLRP